MILSRAGRYCGKQPTSSAYSRVATPDHLHQGIGIGIALDLCESVRLAGSLANAIHMLKFTHVVLLARRGASPKSKCLEGCPAGVVIGVEPRKSRYGHSTQVRGKGYKNSTQ
ncbi:hypothetical protein LIA77_06770 [Sarocladium implicatum]|nr:hypothetical protein LIA77_06770 [Sarocladium implicatum]